jgi:hypothetical protein
MLVHIFVGKLRFLNDDRWPAIGAGVATSYVFLDILPHLASKQKMLGSAAEAGGWDYLQHHAYLLTLFGFLVYLGLAILARRTSSDESQEVAPAKIRMTAYLVGSAFAGYDFLIGYMIGEQPDHRPEPVIIFAVAMAIHIAGVDHLVWHRYPTIYRQALRVFLVTATFAGWLLGAFTEVPAALFALIFSLLVGVIIVVAAVFELPAALEPRRYWLFVASASLFAALLLLYEGLAKTPLSA